MKRFLSAILTLALAVVAVSVFAQGAPPPPPPPPPPPSPVPIDGGVLALLAGGIAYGAKKLYSKG